MLRRRQLAVVAAVAAVAAVPEPAVAAKPLA